MLWIKTKFSKISKLFKLVKVVNYYLSVSSFLILENCIFSSIKYTLCFDLKEVKHKEIYWTWLFDCELKNELYVNTLDEVKSINNC